MGKNYNLLKIIICILLTFIIFGFSAVPCEEKISDVVEIRLIDDIELDVSEDAVFSEVTDLLIDKNNNILILDWRSKQIYIFNIKGKYIKSIGGAGQGPGEFMEPSSFAFGPKHELFINDPFVMLVHVLDSSYCYKYSIRFNKRMNRHLLIDPKYNLFLYDSKRSFSSDILPMTIFRYDSSGHFIDSFAQLESKVLEINMISSKNGVIFDEDYDIIEVHPLYYQIRKFKRNGQLIYSKTPKSNLYYVEKNKNKYPVVLNGPYHLGGGNFLVQLRNHIDVFNDSGVKLLDEFFFKEQIVFSKKNYFYTIVWPFEQDIDNVKVKGPKIKKYIIKLH